MKTKIHHSLFFLIISLIILNSCKSSFPVTGTLIDCNGEQVIPVLNPTVRPTFPGGSQAMKQFLFDNVNIPLDIEAKGKVRVAFIVKENGEICDVRVTSKPKEYLDEEVSRVFRMMPKWTPGTDEGEIVDSYVLIDINF
jgi:hypothetical protein